MKAKDMREKSVEDLVELERSLVKEAFQARFKNFTARLDDTSSLRKARRDIARVKTLLTERAKGTGAKTAAAAPQKKAAPAKAAKAAPKAAKAAAPAKAAPSKPAAKTTKAKKAEQSEASK